MIQSRTFLSIATAAAMGVSLAAWAPPSFAQLAPAVPAPAASAPTTTAVQPKATKTPRARGGIEGRIKQLHDDLKITPAQEDQWSATTKVMRDNDKDLADLTKKRRDGTASMTAVDNLKNYQQITDQRADGLKALIPSFQKLYDSMSDAQKKNADAVFGQRIARQTHTKKPAAAPTKS